MKFKILFLIVPLFIWSCNHKTNIATTNTAIKNHKIIAILPPQIKIQTTKVVDEEAILAKQQEESRIIHDEIYTWLLKSKISNKLSVEILDVSSTLSILMANNIQISKDINSKELCRLLKVDAVLNSQFTSIDAIPEGAAIALGVLAGVWDSTHDSTVSLELYSKESNLPFWNYNYSTVEEEIMSPGSLVEFIMGKASETFPYMK